MARDQVLAKLYDSLHEPFPPGLVDPGPDWFELDQLSDGIAGTASHNVNDTNPLTAGHRI